MAGVRNALTSEKPSMMVAQKVPQAVSIHFLPKLPQSKTRLVGLQECVTERCLCVNTGNITQCIACYVCKQATTVPGNQCSKHCCRLLIDKAGDPLSLPCACKPRWSSKSRHVKWLASTGPSQKQLLPDRAHIRSTCVPGCYSTLQASEQDGVKHRSQAVLGVQWSCLFGLTHPGNFH